VDAAEEPVADQEAVDADHTVGEHAADNNSDADQDGAVNASHDVSAYASSDDIAVNASQDVADNAAALHDPGADPGADTGAHPDLHPSVPSGALGGRLVPAGFLIRLAGTFLD
jgi:hypothetical protein